MASLSLSIVEIVVLMLGAITLGFTIHFFVASRNSMKFSPMENEKVAKALEDWKLRYFNDTEIRDKELTSLRKQLEELHENNEINVIEAEEMRKDNKRLRLELENSAKEKPAASPESTGYIHQLREAQSSLMAHNEKINHLLGQIDMVKETEERQREAQKINEDLGNQVDELKNMLAQKEREIHNTRQKEQLTTEMNSMIDSAYNEFNVLQDKIQKLEAQVNASKILSLDFDEMKESHYRLVQEHEEIKKKYHTIQSDHNQLHEELTETEDKLREANFQRQQLQKRVSYLEELNQDMQVVTDANKKLEGQLKRIGELESMLNVVAEERDRLEKRQFNS